MMTEDKKETLLAIFKNEYIRKFKFERQLQAWELKKYSNSIFGVCSALPYSNTILKKLKEEGLLKVYSNQGNMYYPSESFFDEIQALALIEMSISSDFFEIIKLKESCESYISHQKSLYIKRNAIRDCSVKIKVIKKVK